MPKFNNVPPTVVVLSTFQPKKIPPKPPQRRHFVRHDPEGSQQQQPVTGEFHERKTPQLAVVQQTPKVAREPLQPAININQQHLLQHSMPPPTNSHAAHHRANLIFGTQQRQMLQLPRLQQQQQLVHASVMRNGHNQSHNAGAAAARSGEKSDPENHIYEMIDEYEVSGQKVQQKQQAIRADEESEVGEEVTKHGHDLFQNLLQTEMLNQMRLCRGSGSFLSHLTKEKRMEIMQETALTLASAAYIEK
jgi:hypothetical protein